MIGTVFREVGKNQRTTESVMIGNKYPDTCVRMSTFDGNGSNSKTLLSRTTTIHAEVRLERSTYGTILDSCATQTNSSCTNVPASHHGRTRTKFTCRNCSLLIGPRAEPPPHTPPFLLLPDPTPPDILLALPPPFSPW